MITKTCPSCDGDGWLRGGPAVDYEETECHICRGAGIMCSFCYPCPDWGNCDPVMCLKWVGAVTSEHERETI